MKKLLSIVLTLALLVSCVAAIPSLTTSAADTATSVLSNDLNSDIYTEIFDSADYTANGFINPNITTSDKDKGFWLADNDNTWLSNNTNNQDALYMGVKDVSGKLLERNKAVTTNIDNFEWQFEYRTDNDSTANVSFAFHVNGNRSDYPSDISSYSARKNILAVTLYGSSFDASTTSFVVPDALVVEYGNTSGKMRPQAYETKDSDGNNLSVMPARADSYIKLKDDKATAIDYTKYITINIKMVGRKLVLSVWQSSNKDATYRELTVATLNGSNYLTSGDFAIISGASSSNYKISNMTISRPSLLFDSSVNTIKQNPGNSAQTYSGGAKTVGDITSSSGVHTLPRYSATDEILENALGEEINLTDFVWEAEFRATEQLAQSGIVFNSHVDKDRTDAASQMPGDLTGYTMTSRRYMQSTVVHTAGYASNDDMLPSTAAISIQSSDTAWSGTAGNVHAADFVNVDGKRYPRSAEALTADLAVNVWYTVRIVQSGNNYYTYIWKTDDKANTLRSVYHKFTDTQMASTPSGDFAILADFKAEIRNMRIWDNLDVIRSAEDYSEYTNILPATTYDFENGLNDVNFGLGELRKDAPSAEDKIITFETVEDGNGGKRLQAGSDTDNERTRIDNLDGYSQNLADFIFTTEFETTKRTSDWSNDQIVFRGNGVDYYALELRRRSRNNSDEEFKLNHDYIALVKRIDGATITLAETSLSRSYSYDVNYKIKLAAIGNTITVWFAEDDLFTQPIITYTDSENPLTTGIMYIYHSTDTVAYYDNINIYDITATELASNIDAATGNNVKRGDDAAIDELVSKYNAMDPSQHTKLSTRKAALDAAVAKLAELEKAGHDVNGSNEVDIRDIVAMRNYLVDPENAIIAENVDPLFDGTPDCNDIVKLRYWILGLEWTDSAVQ